MNTPEQSWYYVDLKVGQITLKHENDSRWQRWLHYGLHSLDFRSLVYKRPLWDIVVWVLMLGGTAVSATGLVLTWKWLRRKIRKLRKKKLFLSPPVSLVRRTARVKSYESRA